MADVDLSVIPALRAVWGDSRDRRPDRHGPVAEMPAPARSPGRS